MKIIANPSEFTEIVENQEYNFETDRQNQFRYLNGGELDCVETKDSYIFLRNSHLFVFDKITKNYHILCGNPSCKHGYVETCSAFINGIKSIEYYNGSIYAVVSDIGFDEGGHRISTLELYKISINAHDREKVCQIASAFDVKGMDTNCFSVWCAAIHRGYLYYMYSYGTGQTEDSYYVNHSNTLYRISLDGKQEAECICAMEYGGDVNNLDINCQGSYIYFLKTEKLENGYGYLYRLNTESMKLEYIDIGEIMTYIIVNDEIIYKEKEGSTYYAYNMNTRDKYEYLSLEKIEDLEHGYMMHDGEYLYIKLFNIDLRKDYWEVYTLEKEKINQYECSEIVEKKDEGDRIITFQNGGDDFDFMVAIDGSMLMYLDKSQLENGSIEFVLAE